MIFFIPIKIVSEANLREHWTRGHKRHKIQKELITWAIRPFLSEIRLPCKITFTRLAPRYLDDDNLSYACKHCRDYLCDLLIPGKAMGQADRDPRLSFEYAQEKVKAKDCGLRIEIT